MSALDELWGSVVTEILLDPGSSRLALELELTDRGESAGRSLECLGVEALNFVTDGTEWDYAELTAAELRGVSNSAVELTACFWQEERRLMVRCREVRLDGAPVPPD